MRAAIIMLLGGLLAFAACSTKEATTLPGTESTGLVPLAPVELGRGAQLYKEQCAPCHGETGRGDGWKAEELKGPKPRNYLDPGVRDLLSAQRVFIAVRDGMPNSAMQSFELLSPRDRWHLAYFVMSLGYDESMVDEGLQELEHLDLLSTNARALASLSNSELRDELMQRGSSPQKASAAIAYLRTRLSFQLERSPTASARMRLADAVTHYRKGEHSQAIELVGQTRLDDSSALLDILRLRSGSLALAIDRSLQQLRSLMSKGAVVGDMEELAQRVISGFDLADPKLDAPPKASIGAAQSASIALGYGADGALFIFVLMMIAGRRSRDRQERRMVALGSLLGLALAVLLWLAWTSVGSHASLAGSRRAFITLALSGVVALASLPLLVEILRYFRWPRDRRPTAGAAGYIALFVFSTLVVVRDALEIVPTISLIAQRTPASLLGFVGAGIVIVLLLSLFIILEKKMAPVERSGFLCIAATMAAVMAAGSCARAAQELGLLSATPLGALQSPWFGFWPTVQSVALQLAITVLCAIILVAGTSMKRSARDTKESR